MNVGGRLGDGTNVNRRLPVRIMEDVASVFGGLDFTMAITLDGGLWTFGVNHHGQLGIGEAEPSWDRGVYPQRILENVMYSAGGASHGLALDGDGNIWSWGRNDYGQLGDGTMVERHSPQRVIYQE